MKKTHIVLIVDKSGSMSNVTDDTVGGFNSYLDGLKGNPRVSAMLFDTDFKVLFQDATPRKATRLNKTNYRPSGNTALYDAVGKTMEELEFPEGDNVLCVIMTDGQENSSREFSSERVKQMINDAGWDFMYLGADMDAWGVSRLMGIAQNKTFYSKMGTGTDVRTLYEGITCASNAYTIEKRRFDTYGGVDNAAAASANAYASTTQPITTTYDQAKDTIGPHNKKAWNANE